MIRDIDTLSSSQFDVLIIGGGVYGAAAAREAALRGLSTALIEKADFCSGTSANSLKIIHGGLRYLQQLNFARTRSSSLARRELMSIAPHLVHPLPCAMPTKGHSMKGKEALFMGMLLNDILTFDRNTLGDPEKNIPRGKVIQKSTCMQLLPGISSQGVTGAALWHDAVAYNTERLVLAMVQAAEAAGAQTANYLTVKGFKEANSRVSGVMVKDELTGKTSEIDASIVLNCTGPWADELLGTMSKPIRPIIPGLALSVNFILKRLLIPDIAAGLSFAADTGTRLLFLMPWRGRTLAGTYYRSHEGPPSALKVTDEDIDLFIRDLNTAYPSSLTRDDIAIMHAGLLPTVEATHNERDPQLLGHSRMIDHAAVDGIEGLCSVVSIKYTTATTEARQAISMVERKLGHNRNRPTSDDQKLPGSNFETFDQLQKNVQEAGGSPQLALNYGSTYRDLLTNSETLSDQTDVLKSEVLQASRNDMAQTLCDTVYRRTELGSAGISDHTALAAAAAIMAEEKGWDAMRVAKEIEMAQGAIFPGSESYSL